MIIVGMFKKKVHFKMKINLLTLVVPNPQKKNIYIYFFFFSRIEVGRNQNYLFTNILLSYK